LIKYPGAKKCTNPVILLEEKDTGPRRGGRGKSEITSAL